MNNLPQDSRLRWAQPRLKKPWQRFLLTLAVGLIMGLLFQWTLANFDPERVVYTRQWRRSLTKFMLDIADPETWFWIILIFYLVMATLNEAYYYYIGKKVKSKR